MDDGTYVPPPATAWDDANSAFGTLIVFGVFVLFCWWNYHAGQDQGKDGKDGFWSTFFSGMGYLNLIGAGLCGIVPSIHDLNVFLAFGSYFIFCFLFYCGLKKTKGSVLSTKENFISKDDIEDNDWLINENGDEKYSWLMNEAINIFLSSNNHLWKIDELILNKNIDKKNKAEKMFEQFSSQQIQQNIKMQSDIMDVLTTLPSLEEKWKVFFYIDQKILNNLQFSKERKFIQRQIFAGIFVQSLSNIEKVQFSNNNEFQKYYQEIFTIR